MLYSPRWSSGKQMNHPTSVVAAEPQMDGEALLDGNEDENASGSSAESAPPSSSSNDDNPSDNSDPPDSPPPSSLPPSTQSSIAKQSVPEIYPQVLALPIARRPLFPGFYKAVVIRNPAVVSAIKEMMKRGQPYIGAFLLKDENTDSDVITDINSVHAVGVFAQITSVFAANSGPAKEGEGEKEEGLTAVLYPHRRIKITELVKAGNSTAVVENAERDETKAQTVTPPPSPTLLEPELSPEQLGKLHPGMQGSCLFYPRFF